MLLNIDSVKTNPSGKSCMVKAGGKDYFAKPQMGLAAGMSIDAETEDSEYNGKTNTWIKKFKKIEGAAHAAAAAASNPPATGMAWLPMASNVVAHAIAAGKIEGPNQVAAWVRAVRMAVNNDATEEDVPY